MSAEEFQVGDLVEMFPDPRYPQHAVRCRVVKVSPGHLTVIRLSDSKRLTRALTKTVTYRDRFRVTRSQESAFRLLTPRDLWRGEEPAPVSGVGRGYLSPHRSVEIQDIAVRDHLDDVIAYLTARAEWLRREPKQ